jgi:phosphoribosylamine---glycine ligase
MKILVLGSGGREHALVWKLRQSARVSKVYCAPGNGGIADEAECLPVDLKSWIRWWLWGSNCSRILRW